MPQTALPRWHRFAAERGQKVEVTQRLGTSRPEALRPRVSMKRKRRKKVFWKLAAVRLQREQRGGWLGGCKARNTCMVGRRLAHPGACCGGHSRCCTSACRSRNSGQRCARTR